MPHRIALIHALAHSVGPINAELERAWPQALRMNLLDDSLSADLAAVGTLDARMDERFVALADYALRTGASGILFTCSAFGPCIDAVRRRWPDVPVLKPNEAMIDDAVRIGSRIGLVASFAPTLASMPAEFPPGTELHPVLAEGALDALHRGDAATHDRLVAAAAQRVAADCDAIALAQFSLARAAPTVERAVSLPVLTTPGSAVRAIRERVERAVRSPPPVDVAGLASWLARKYPDVASIDVPVLARWVGDRSRAAPVLIDVRTANEQAVSTLPGALCVAPGDDAAEVLRRVGAARAIVAYCAVGVRSAKLARALAAAGAVNVQSLRGGIFEWANRGLPLAGPSGPAQRVHGYDAAWQALLDPRLRA
jgi:rhodanese-related sulfurtransferase/aspartate/glutamate racemase